MSGVFTILLSGNLSSWSDTSVILLQKVYLCNIVAYNILMFLVMAEEAETSVSVEAAQGEHKAELKKIEEKKSRHNGRNVLVEV